ncbi:hypothetical protein F4703DRAFT_1932060 [Phycomyces blakesleeanus]
MPAIVEVEKTRSPSHTIIGAIHSSSILHVAMKKPPPIRKKAQKFQINKKPVLEYVEVESSDDREVNKPPSKSTTTTRFIKFMNEVLDSMGMDDLSQRITDACNNKRSKQFLN